MHFKEFGIKRLRLLILTLGDWGGEDKEKCGKISLANIYRRVGVGKRRSAFQMFWYVFHCIKRRRRGEGKEKCNKRSVAIIYLGVSLGKK